jgi:hypothetical protein
MLERDITIRPAPTGAGATNGTTGPHERAPAPVEVERLGTDQLGRTTRVSGWLRLQCRLTEP